MKMMAIVAVLGLEIAGAGCMAESDMTQATKAPVTEQTAEAAQAAETADEREAERSEEEAALAKQQLL